MTASQPSLREITPEQRQRTQRTFLTILLAFAAGIGIMVATLSVGGRAIRDYGQGVLTDFQQHPAWSASGDDRWACADVSQRRPPPGLLSCTVERQDGKLSAVLKIEGDRQYRVQP